MHISRDEAACEAWLFGRTTFGLQSRCGNWQSLTHENNTSARKGTLPAKAPTTYQHQLPWSDAGIETLVLCRHRSSCLMQASKQLHVSITHICCIHHAHTYIMHITYIHHTSSHHTHHVHMNIHTYTRTYIHTSCTCQSCLMQAARHWPYAACNVHVVELYMAEQSWVR